MKLDVYGRIIEVVKSEGRWKVYILGSEGKKRLADEVTIPSHIAESDLIRYIADLYHEWAGPGHNKVTELK